MADATGPVRRGLARVGGMLEDAPELEAKALFEFLAEERHGRYQEGQLRTFQRRVREWRATEGPPKEVFFPQEHRAGEAMQTDFTWLMRLGVTIGGEPYEGACATWCCRTRTGSGGRCVSRSRCWR